MAHKQQTLLLDTNVWLDYFDASRAGSKSAVELVRFACENDIGLLVTPMSCKDFYYQSAQAVKRAAREAGKDVTPDISAAAEEFAWGCLQNLVETAEVASTGLTDVRMARTIHQIHRDFEDDLVVAVAMRCGVDYLITGDRRLAARSPVPTLDAALALTMLSG